MKRRYWRRRMRDFALLFSVLFCLAGILYPLAANAVYENRQDRIFSEYEGWVSEAAEAELAEEKEACARYNRRLSENSPVAAGYTEDRESEAERMEEYRSRLDLS